VRLALGRRSRRGVAAPAASLRDLGWTAGLELHVGGGAGERPGDRRVPGHPQPAGIEVEAHGPYAPGDDLRHLDWAALRRLDALLVRRYTAEREAAVHVLLDASASMAVPADDGKGAVACELVLALALVALGTNDALRVTTLGGAGAGLTTPVLRHRASAPRVAALLGAVRFAGTLALPYAIAAWARPQRRAGTAILVSDLMTEPAHVEQALRTLRARRWITVVLHVLGRSEVEPPSAGGHGVVRDVESGARRAVLLDPGALDAYRAALRTHLAALEAAAARTHTVYARLVTDRGVRAFVTEDLVRRGLVRPS
jgi:uncharacterized protein (DUF58 family)